MEPAIVVLVVLLVVVILVGGGVGVWLLVRPKKEDEDEVVTFAPPAPAPRAAPPAPLPPIYLAYPDEAPARIRTSDPKVVVAPPRAAPPISLPLPLTLPTFSKPVIAAPRPPSVPSVPSVHVIGFPSNSRQIQPPGIPPIPQVQVKPKGTCGVGTVWDSGKKICRAPKTPAGPGTGGTKYPEWANKSQNSRDIYDRAIEAQRRIKAARSGK